MEEGKYWAAGEHGHVGRLNGATHGFSNTGPSAGPKLVSSCEK